LLVIWGTVKDDLPPLKAAVQRALETMPAAESKSDLLD
jgi:uncharacterized protein with HEPN domain